MLPFLSFFEELEVDDEPTSESQPRRRPRLPRRGNGDGSAGGGGGGGARSAGLQRLLILGGVVLLIVAIGIWQIRRCQHDREVKSYKNFVTSANTVAKGSQDVGNQFSAALLAQGQTPDKLDSTIDELIGKQQALTKTAQGLNGPGDLGTLQPWLTTSMQYRVSGLQGFKQALAQAFTAANKKSGEVTAEQAAAVAATYDRLIASDVVYADSYQDPAKAVLDDKGIDGVDVAPSVFLDSDALEFASPDRMKVALDALLGGTSSSTSSGSSGSTGSTDTTNPNGKHGLALDTGAVSIVPDGQPAVVLSTTELNDADATNNMKLRVKVKNSGDFPETGITVTATVADTPLSGKIQALEAGQTETIDLPFTNDDIDISAITNITVTAEPVQGESNPDNNQQKFRVQFKLPA